MNEISTEDLQSLIVQKKNFVLIDCRCVHDFRKEHIPGAINLRWKYVNERAPDLLPNFRQQIVTYCQSFLCNASSKAYKSLLGLGYKNLLEYSGGLEDWRAHGGTVLSDPSARLNERTYRFGGQRFYGNEVGCYLLETPDKIILVDAPQQYDEEIETFIEDFEKPLHILLTHDSTGGCADMLRQQFDAKVYLHEADRNGQWLSVQPTEIIRDGHSFGDGLTVLHTPGHTPGSISLYDSVHKSLFSGDHFEISKVGKLLPFREEQPERHSRSAWLRSSEKLSRLDFTALYPFHYAMLQNGPRQELKILLKENYDGDESSNY